MNWKVFALASAISFALAEHTGVDHSGCSQSGSIQPIPYVPVVNGEYVNSAELYDAWKASLDSDDLCLHEPDEAENKRGKEELHIGDYLLIKWEFQSGSTLAADQEANDYRPSGFLRGNFPIFIKNACKTSKCIEPAIDLGSGEVLFPVELNIQEETGVLPVLRYNSWTPPSSDGTGIVVAQPNPDFPKQPIGLGKRQWALTNLALTTKVDIPFNVDDKLGNLCLAVGAFISALYPEIGSFQTKITAYPDNGYIDENGDAVETDARFQSIMVIDSQTCSNVPPVLETSISGVSQILMAKPPPASPPPPVPCPPKCHESCKDYAACKLSGGVDCEAKAGNPGCYGLWAEECSTYYDCYFPCTKNDGLPVEGPECTPECAAYLQPDCSTPAMPCPPKCHIQCHDYATCKSTGGVGCEAVAGDPMCYGAWEMECSKYYTCFYGCTKNVGAPVISETCTEECYTYLTPDCYSEPALQPSPPPFPPPFPPYRRSKPKPSPPPPKKHSPSSYNPKRPHYATHPDKMGEPMPTKPIRIHSNAGGGGSGGHSSTGGGAMSMPYYPEDTATHGGGGMGEPVPYHDSPATHSGNGMGMQHYSDSPATHGGDGMGMHISGSTGGGGGGHSPPPEYCPHHCFDQCKDYAACMSTLGVGCDTLAMSPMCYGEWEDECMMFYECYWGCTENKHKPKPSGSCSAECASYLVPDCFPYTVSKDPHFQLPHGGRADFRGEHNSIFNLLSAKNMSMNVMITDADFAWNKRTVHGTKMSAAYWVVRTQKNKMIHIEYNTTGKGAAIYEDKTTPIVLADEQSGEFVRDNLHVQFVEKNKLRVKTEKWEMAATKSPFPFQNLNKGKVLLDVEIAALYDADSDIVAPHGIFGQAYDGDQLAIDGAMDTERDTETSTKAQAEGAIEGTWTDYKMESKFATAFKYARFDATSAKPRDVATLTGIKRSAGKSRSAGKAVSVAL
eukprot:CAMPEP_0119301860 /NCGR_PEP_ID=MMETSP1333-20130426/3567_1 /TAXON_ID=418940 /ORGANISM="Scyphosphaera apsteinii, Strain RCC1455" /LENGTH=957 /DNA_ID=CAMNT_0007304057 /DNA_START=71 /DNA_END=2944 /DNA_ORIENTATION=-